MRENGYDLVVQDATDFNALLEKYGVPDQLQSCHTAIVDGYVIEGHVPVDEIARLLQEGPDIVGLAVPGMPPGSPGMGSSEPVGEFSVYAFDSSGNVEIFASYPK
jgi:hypothetical protein